MENVPTIVFILQNGELLYINPMAELITGYSQDEMTDSDIEQLLNFDDTLLDSAQTLIFGNRRTLNVPRREVKITRKDGTERWLDLMILTINLEGKIAFLGIGLDITQRKEVEQQAIHLQLEKERVDLLADFVRDVSHDLRSPLSTINASMYLLSRYVDNPERIGHHIGIIKEQVGKLDRLIEGLLTMTRLDSHTAFTFQCTNIHSLLMELLDDVRDKYAHIEHQIDLQSKDSALALQIDRVEFNRAVTHLVENAIIFTPEPGQISVTLSQHGDSVFLAVSDNGIGIAADEQQRIFERFYRVDRSSVDSGLGLGLAIAQRIIEYHDGTIEVESVPEKGSTFTIRLPYAACEVIEDDV